MYYVYLIQSLKNPQSRYVGYTIDLNKRLEKHNSGGSVYTSVDRPWELIVCLCFKDMERAKLFEKYLKSGSGGAFAQKRFW
jgi:putative endonuclease